MKREHPQTLRLDFISRERRTAGAVPPTLATQLNNGDILRAPARRPAAIPGSDRSSPPLPAACRERSQLARPHKVSPRPPPGAGRRHRELAALGRLPAAAPAAAAVRQKKCRAGPGRGRVPPPPRSASAGRAAAAHPGKAGRERARPPATRPKTQTTACYLIALPFYVIQRRRQDSQVLKNKIISHVVHVTFWEHAGIELTLNIKRSSRRSSL